MSRSSGLHGTTTTNGGKKLKGVRRRKWGKWVSEIRVPGKQERLWLGTYATPEAAAVAHDVAVYCLRRPSSLDKLNFPDTLSSYCNCIQHSEDLSPRSVQKVASDVAMDVDARNIAGTTQTVAGTTNVRDNETSDDHRYNTSVCDVGFGAAVDDSGVSWWEGWGDDGGTSQGSEDHGEGDRALSISVEDYL